MTATDELRRLLDERGVEWWDESLAMFGGGVDSYTPYGGTREHPSGVYVEESNGTRLLIVPDLTPEQAVEATLGPQITGETSDGYHTFNELYHHRAVLFSVIVSNYRAAAWKSKLHHDGTMYDGMFIVGIGTPYGQASYHYDIDPYWDMFRCRELDRAPEWDGHTPDQAIERIGRLATLGREVDKGEPQGADGHLDQSQVDWLRLMPDGWDPSQGLGRGECRNVCNSISEFTCSECGFNCDLTSWISLFDGDDGRHRHHHHGVPNFCPNCGLAVKQ